MSTSSSPGTRPSWLVVAGLLTVGIVVPLLVWIYDSVEPTLFGFPFYYWFQFLLIPIVSLLTWIAFKISEGATDRDRAAHGLRPHPTASQDGEKR